VRPLGGAGRVPVEAVRGGVVPADGLPST
jgi:hypothetical protein